MIDQQALQGNWNEIKGELRSKWDSLTDEDLPVFNGDVDQLVGTIQRRTGEARESIEQFVEQLASGSGSTLRRAGESVREFAHQTSDSIQETSQRVADSARQGYADAEEMVRQRPAESVAVFFGAGVITGVLVTLLLRSR